MSSGQFPIDIANIDFCFNFNPSRCSFKKNIIVMLEERDSARRISMTILSLSWHMSRTGFQRSKTDNRRQKVPELSDPEYPGVGHFSGTSQDRAFFPTFSSRFVVFLTSCRPVAIIVRLSCARAATVPASFPKRNKSLRKLFVSYEYNMQQTRLEAHDCFVKNRILRCGRI